MSKNEHGYCRFAFFHQSEPLLYQFFLNECLESLKSEKTLEKLTDGFIHPWNRVCGHLPHMLYFYELQKNTFGETPQMKSIGEILRKIYQSSLKLTVLKEEIKKVLKLLLELLPLYRDNPQVLYYILSHNEQFDVKNLFKPLFVGGLSEAEAFLSKEFEKKGFHHLLPHIHKHMEKVIHG